VWYKYDLASDGIDVVEAGCGCDGVHVFTLHQGQDGGENVHSPLLRVEWVVEDVDEGVFDPFHVEVVEHLDGADQVRRRGAVPSADPRQVVPSSHTGQVLDPIDIYVDTISVMLTSNNYVDIYFYMSTYRHICRHN
jgi:hypothetical protein